MYWAGAVTQCDSDELSKFIGNQVHSLLAFLSGAFTFVQEHWTTYEKEVFAIYSTFKRLDYVRACDGTTRVFTDNLNITAVETSLGRHKILKVTRRALFLAPFTYKIEHVSGDNNLLLDLMTRWMRGYRGRPLFIKKIRA